METTYINVRFGSGSVSKYALYAATTPGEIIANLQRQAAEATELDLADIACTRQDLEPVEWWVADGFELARSFLRKYTMPGYERQTEQVIERITHRGR